MKTSMSRSTFKILFYVKKGSERANGYLPLMCRLTVDGEIKQFSCKLDVPPKLWDVKTARATGKSAEAQKINAEVDRIRVDVNRRYQELMQSDGYVTAARLRDACLGLGVKRETLLKLFEQHNEEFIKKVGHSRVQGTYNRYRTIYRHLCEFVPKVYRRDDIPLKELNLTFINNFEYFLRTEKKCRTNTVWGYMIGLKHVISIARNSGALPFNPFAGYINSPESVDRGYLTEREIQTLMEAPVKSGTCELVRDLFIFSVFTGLAYADVKALTTDRLQTFFDGNLWIIPPAQDKHRVQHPPAGRSQAHHREVQGAIQGRSCISGTEQRQMQHHIEGTWQAVRFQDKADLSCCPAYERHHRAALARCAHRDRKPSFGAYGFENHPDICPDNQPEDQQRHGNPVP